MADLSYVRKEMVPEQAPPPSTIGAIGWLVGRRRNFFDIPNFLAQDSGVIPGKTEFGI